MNEIYVSQLNTYPVKSCAGISLQEAVVGEHGLLFDREWMATRANGTMLTARTHTSLLRIQTALTEDSLLLSADGHGELAIPLDADELAGNEEVPVNVFKKPGTGIDQGPEASEFLSSYLGLPVRLLRVKQSRRIIPEVRLDGFGTEMGFADGSAITLASEVSLRALAHVAKSPEDQKKILDRRRLRANVWVDGDLAPYTEDMWLDIAIGALEARVRWANGRCPEPNGDPDTGVMPKPDARVVTQALRASRMGISPVTGQEEEFIAQNVLRRTGPDAVIKIGDKVTVVSQASEPNFTPLPVRP